MAEPEIIWRIARPDPDAVASLARSSGLPPIIALLLVNRGIAQAADAARFLRPDLAALRDPACLPDIDIAADRLARALRDGETIFVHGDYDTDGLTSAALIQRALTGLGANPVIYVPQRADGYDLQKAGVDKAHAAGATLIFTADCGIRAVEPVEYARTLGIDVIITDHHRPGPVLPAALAVVDPYRLECELPFRDWCGVAVAYKVLEALVLRVAPQHRDSFRRNFLDIVALGTVADMSPILDDNRILVSHGLTALAQSRKVGIQALLTTLDLSGKPLTARNISWHLGPRLNAAGRMEDVSLALRLLTTKDPLEAEQLAVQLVALHDKTREETSRVTSEAMAMALLPENAGRRVLVLARDAWGKSVAGIAAARIVEQCRRPVILLAHDAATDTYHGSGRSYGGFDLHAALQECAPLLGRFGGHSAAAGLSLPAANLVPFRDRLHELAADLISDEPVAPTLEVDAEVDGGIWDYATVELMEKLAPFGQGNPEPVFVTRGVMALRPSRIGKEGTTFRMDARFPGSSRVLKAIAFGEGAWADDLAPGDEVDIAYTPVINQWNGQVNVELQLKDLQRAG